MSNRDALKHLGNVTPQTRAVATEIADHLDKLGLKMHRYGAPYNGPVMHGYANGSEHGTGRAIDVMVYTPGAVGDAVVDFVIANRQRFGLTHILWKQRIYSTVVSPGVWRGMSDRGSPTENHMDHPHIFLNGKMDTSKSKVEVAQKASYYQPKGVSMSVKEIQKAVGVKADGYYGDDTSLAVREYQKQIGIRGKAVDGLWGPTTEKAYIAAGKPKPKKSAPAKKPAAKKSKGAGLVVDGKLGPATYKALQRKVGAKPVDGKFGPITKKALQSYLGVRADGLVGPRTVRALQRKVGSSVDGIWGPATTRAVQRWLNG